MSDVSECEEKQLSCEIRLGSCETCNIKEAKYTCPRCEVKTCGLACLNIHKRELKCDGIRDRTKYIPLVKMTRMDLMNDYYFLEECTQFVEARKRDNRKRFTCYNKHLPNSMVRLRQAALARGTTLKFLLQNFTKRQKNTTHLDAKSGTIFWRIEWCFPNGDETIVFTDDNVSETCKLYDVVDKYLQPAAKSKIPCASKLEFYQASSISGVHLLLKAEGIKQCRNRGSLLNINDSLRESLRNKIVVEFPTIYVVLKDQLAQFDVVDSDDDIEAEMRQCNNYENEENDTRQDPSVSHTSLIENQFDQMEIDKTKVEKRKYDTHSHENSSNFLFSDEGFLAELSDSNEEDMDSFKRVKPS